jgi:excisionase family DNA binding protein
MTERRPDRKPVQMSLFEQRTVPVSWVAKRWNTGRDTVTRLLHEGRLRGYRITVKGWWRVIEKSVFEYEENLRQEYGSEPEKGGK